MKNLKKYMLVISMAAVTLLAAAAVLTTLHVFRAQEAAMDSMMRSYVMDLTDSVSGILPDAGRRHGGMRRMQLRMLSASPGLSADAGGILVLTAGGQILWASAGAEKLVPLWRQALQAGTAEAAKEPATVRDADGNQYCVVAQKTEAGLCVLAAVSRTYLLGPILNVRRQWMYLATLTSFAVFASMLGLWIYLAAPLRRLAESVRSMKWGRDRPQTPKRLGFYEVEALSGAISELAGEAIAREELRARYVSDIVQVQEDSRKRLARDLHDSPLQCVVAAIKRIQLARSGAAPGSSPNFNLSKNLEIAEEVAQSAAREIRNYCDELSPSWVKLGLSAAMSENAGRLSQAFGVEVSGAEEIDDAWRIPEEHVLAFVRILQEAVSNSARHGGATRAEVSLRKENGRMLLRVQDNGSGFAARGDIDYENLRATGHRGLAHIHERAQLLKGTMRLESQPGSGCLIEVDVPV